MDSRLGSPIGHRVSPQGYTVLGVRSIYFSTITDGCTGFSSIDKRIGSQCNRIRPIGVGTLFSHVIAPDGNPIGMVRRAVLPNSNRTLIIHDGIFPDGNSIGIIVRLGPGPDGYGIRSMGFGLFPESEGSSHGGFRRMADGHAIFYRSMCRFTQGYGRIPLGRCTLPDSNSVGLFRRGLIADDYIIGPFTGSIAPQNDAVVTAFSSIANGANGNGIIVQFAIVLGLAKTKAMFLAVISKFSIIEQ